MDDPKTLALMRIRELILEWVDGNRPAAETLADIAMLYHDPEAELDLPSVSERSMH